MENRGAKEGKMEIEGGGEGRQVLLSLSWSYGKEKVWNLILTRQPRRRRTFEARRKKKKRDEEKAPSVVFVALSVCFWRKMKQLQQR